MRNKKKTKAQRIKGFESTRRTVVELEHDLPDRLAVEETRQLSEEGFADISCSFPMVSGDRELFMAVFRDVSERRQAEEALRESEAREPTRRFCRPARLTTGRAESYISCLIPILYH